MAKKQHKVIGEVLVENEIEDLLENSTLPLELKNLLTQAFNMGLRKGLREGMEKSALTSEFLSKNFGK